LSRRQQEEVEDSEKLWFKDMKRMMKLFKAHHCALDFDKGFVAGEMKPIHQAVLENGG